MNAQNDPRNLKLIALHAGDQEFCIDIQTVREIRGWTPTTPLPLSPSYMRGVINLRGVVLPILDLGIRLGFPATAPSERHVIIVVQIGARTLGLLVEGVSDILSFAETEVQPAPDIACDTVRAFVRGVIPHEDRLVSVLALDGLLSEAQAEEAA